MPGPRMIKPAMATTAINTETEGNAQFARARLTAARLADSGAECDKIRVQLHAAGHVLFSLGELELSSSAPLLHSNLIDEPRERSSRGPAHRANPAVDYAARRARLSIIRCR